MIFGDKQPHAPFLCRVSSSGVASRAAFPFVRDVRCEIHLTYFSFFKGNPLQLLGGPGAASQPQEDLGRAGARGTETSPACQRRFLIPQTDNVMAKPVLSRQHPS